MARGRSFLGFGNSSAMCVTPSGVPMVKAPLSTPVRNATPLPQPVVLFQSDHTKELLACCFGITAITMIVTIPPAITWKPSKNLCAVSSGCDIYHEQSEFLQNRQEPVKKHGRCYAEPCYTDQ